MAWYIIITGTHAHTILYTHYTYAVPWFFTIVDHCQSIIVRSTMTGFNGHDKQTVYVATYALQCIAMVYYYYRYTCTHDIIYTLYLCCTMILYCYWSLRSQSGPLWLALTAMISRQYMWLPMLTIHSPVIHVRLSAPRPWSCIVLT